MIEDYVKDGATYVAQVISHENDVYGKRCLGCSFYNTSSCMSAPVCRFAGYPSIIWVIKS